MEKKLASETIFNSDLQESREALIKQQIGMKKKIKEFEMIMIRATRMITELRDEKHAA